MSDPEFRIHSLKAAAEASRLRVRENLSAVQTSFDLAGRVRQSIRAHPIRSAAIAAAGGLVMAKILPLALRLAGRSWGSRVATSILAKAAPPAAAALLRRFHQPSKR